MYFIEFLNGIVFAAIEGLLYLLVYMLLGDRQFIRENKLKAGTFLLMYAFISNFVIAYIPMGVHTILIVAFTAALLSFITKANLYSSALTTIITIIFISAVEVVICSSAVFFLKIDLLLILRDGAGKLCLNVITKFVEILILVSAFKFRLISNLHNHVIFKKEYSLAAFVILQIFVVTVATSAAPVDKNSTLYYFTLIIIYSLILLLGYLEFKEREKIVNIQKKFVMQQEYVKNLETIIDVIRKEKHEFANQLNALTAMCLIKRPDTLDRVEHYAKKLINNTCSSYRFYDTGNTYVDGLLAVKSNLAHQKGITLDICFDASLDRLDADDVDLAGIIGNVLDNAFDAVEENPLDRRIVVLDTYIENDKFCFSITNNGEVIPESQINRIFEQKFSTKKKTGSKEERGFGLYITKQLVDKNAGRIRVGSTDDQTEFLLEFNLKDQQVERRKYASS